MKRFWLSLTTTAATALMPFGLAHADVDDTLKIQARYELFRDSNLFRLPDGASASYQGTTSRSEQIGIGTLGLLLDKSYSLQRFRVNTSLVNYRYQTFDYLSFTALNYDASWAWAFTPRVRGNLVATRREVSNSFSDVRNTSQRNIRTDDSVRLEGEADLGAAVRLLGGLNQFRISNEEPLLQDQDSRTESVFAGVRYVYPSGNDVTYRLRRGQGRYSSIAAGPTTPGVAYGGDFVQTEHELSASWALTGKTRLGARLAYLQRKESDALRGGFSEPIGELQMRWNPLAKLGLEATVAREVRSYQTDYSKYWVGNRYILTPVWRATDRTSLRLRFSQFEQRYAGNRVTNLYPTERHDTTRAASIGLNWQPRDSMLLSVWLQTEKRSSSYSNFQFKNNSASLAAQLTF
jgi:exopolysaccharide biosynthesis operon protein EpsL